MEEQTKTHKAGDVVELPIITTTKRVWRIIHSRFAVIRYIDYTAQPIPCLCVVNKLEWLATGFPRFSLFYSRACAVFENFDISLLPRSHIFPVKMSVCLHLFFLSFIILSCTFLPEITWHLSSSAVVEPTSIKMSMSSSRSPIS